MDINLKKTKDFIEASHICHNKQNWRVRRNMAIDSWCWRRNFRRIKSQTACVGTVWYSVRKRTTERTADIIWKLFQLAKNASPSRVFEGIGWNLARTLCRCCWTKRNTFGSDVSQNFRKNLYFAQGFLIFWYYFWEIHFRCCCFQYWFVFFHVLLCFLTLFLWQQANFLQSFWQKLWQIPRIAESCC